MAGGIGVYANDWNYRGGSPIPGLNGVTPQSQLMLNGGVEDQGTPAPQQNDEPERPIAPIPPSLASLASAAGSGSSGGGGATSAAPGPVAAGSGAVAPAPAPAPGLASPQAAPNTAMAGLSLAADLPRDPSEGFVGQGTSPLNPRLGTRLLPQSVRALSQLTKVY